MTKDELKIHWEHTCNIIQALNNFFEFMVNDENIRPNTFELLNKNLSELFEQYSELHRELEDMDD